MALNKKSNSNKPAATQGVEKAPAWVNQFIVDANGERHNFPRGVPVQVENRVLRSLYHRELANREAFEKAYAQAQAKGSELPVYEPIQFTITAYVSLPNPDADKDIPL